MKKAHHMTGKPGKSGKAPMMVGKGKPAEMPYTSKPKTMKGKAK